jgi:hypothetical protein
VALALSVSCTLDLVHYLNRASRSSSSSLTPKFSPTLIGRGSPCALPTPKLSHTDEQMVVATLALQQQLAHTDLQTVIAALASSNNSPTLTSKRLRHTVFARFVVK